MKKITEDEQTTINIIFKNRFDLKLAKLKENYVDIFNDYYRITDGENENDLSESDIKYLNFYTKDFNYVFYDDVKTKSVCILKDNNFIFPESCFELKNL